MMRKAVAERGRLAEAGFQQPRAAPFGLGFPGSRLFSSAECKPKGSFREAAGGSSAAPGARLRVRGAAAGPSLPFPVCSGEG